MASSLTLDERALILAPRRLATHTSKLLAGAGIACLCAEDGASLLACMVEGAGLVIIAQQTLDDMPDSLLAPFFEQQPQWSDLPIVLLANTPLATSSPLDHPLGNLTLLMAPYEAVQLLHLTQLALRNRRRQYLARDCLHDLQQRLDSRSQAQQTMDLALYQTRKMEAIGQLAGGVAHDFNNLLTSIGGSFELIDRRLRQGRSEGIDGLLHRGQEAVARAAQLTHRLLAFSSRQSLHSQRVDLHALLQGQQVQTAPQARVVLQVQMPADLWPVQADEMQLQEAIDNLLTNACEAMPSGGRLVVGASNQQIAPQQFEGINLANGDYVCLSICDEGHGMSPNILEHAFEPFFSTKPVGQGIGLGLSMVYGFSKQSLGHVVLNSQLGRGTRVDLYLPRHIEQAQPGKSGPQNLASAKGRHVLVVEDDPHVRQLLCQALQEEGFICSSACNAGEALQLLGSSQAIDLLLSDVGLPGMNGRQLAEIARTLRPQLPVLFITGYAETAMAREGFLGQGMQLICKPFELKQLQAQVSRILMGA